MKWYRVEIQRWAAPCDEYGYSEGGRTCLELHEFEILKETPKGVWIDYGLRRFVLRDSKRQFASPTPELALAKFLKRKEKHLAILKTQIDEISGAIEVAKEWQEHGIPPRPSEDIPQLIGIF